jgi:hypothetical protein
MPLWVPHEYQLTAERFVYNNTIANPTGKGGSALFLDPGLGKTSIMLSAISGMREFGYIKRVLIIAPLRVCHKVWPDELRKWDNFRHLSHVVVCSPNAEIRKRRMTMPVDIHVINRDAISWLVETYVKKDRRLPWDLIVIDESSSFRNWSSNRTKALRKLIKNIRYRVILTGTPAPKNYKDLFPQMFLLDEGEALGKTVEQFADRFCTTKELPYSVQVRMREVEANMGDGARLVSFNSLKVREDRYEAMQQAIAPLCLRLDARDYLSIPETTYHDVMVDLPPEARAQYDELEKEMFLALERGERDIINAAALYAACKQVANGGLYDNAKIAHDLHSAKTDAVTGLLEELAGKPALIAYQYEHDKERLKKAIRGLHVVKEKTAEQFGKMVDAWNTDTLDPPYVASHPEPLSYGVNMQYGSCRDIIWYGLTDNLDLYIQLNFRIPRQGMTGTQGVRVHRILAADTVDEVVRDRTDQKFDVQANLLEVLRGYAKQKRS